MSLLEPDGTPSEDGPPAEPGPSAEPGPPVQADPPEWRVPRGKLFLIEVAGPTPAVVETPDARLILEPGGDYLLVAKELYMRMVVELSVYKDLEQRALRSLSHRQQRRRERDIQG